MSIEGDVTGALLSASPFQPYETGIRVWYNLQTDRWALNRFTVKVWYPQLNCSDINQ